MKTLHWMIVLLVTSTSAFSAETFTIDDSHTYPSFEVNHLGWSTTRGRFDKVSGQAILDFAAQTGSVDIAIDATSLSTGHEKRDTVLRDQDFFNVKKYPKITFHANKLQFDGNRVTGADGDLTLLGVSKPVHLTFTWFKCGKHPIPMYQGKYYCGGDANTVIRRSEFGMSIYPGAIGEEVKLAIQVEAVRSEN